MKLLFVISVYYIGQTQTHALTQTGEQFFFSVLAILTYYHTNKQKK